MVAIVRHSFAISRTGGSHLVSRRDGFLLDGFANRMRNLYDRIRMVPEKD